MPVNDTPILYHKTYMAMDESRPWITFIHGAGGSSSIWFKQVRFFMQHFNVLVIDLRGHGKSPKGHKSKIYTFNDITKDIVEVLDHLKILKSHMIGISLGTIIIREIAEAFPDRVNKLVLGGAILKFNLRGQLLMKLGDWTKSFVPYMLLYKLFAIVVMPHRNHKEARTLFINEAKKIAHKEFVRWYKLTASINKVLKLHRNMPFTHPTLYVMGSQDYMFLEPIKSVLKNQHNALLEIIENCGHVVNVEKSDIFNQIVLTYLLDNSNLVL